MSCGSAAGLLLAAVSSNCAPPSVHSPWSAIQAGDVDFTRHLAATVIPTSIAVGIQQFGEVLTHLVSLYSCGAAYILLRCWTLVVDAAPRSFFCVVGC